MEPTDQEKAPPIHSVLSADSPEFALLSWALTRSTVIGLDAEWKPIRSHQHQPTFPTVSLLQIACLLAPENESTYRSSDVSLVFLLDLQAIQLPLVYELLREVFVSPNIVKLGFRFKQDLVYLSSTFCSQGCNAGFDRVSFYNS
ncbi:3'-5' exonuclease domain-containing protein [Abeliophyllum distichum]|uniref:3'-5' exonuclease domain-containing protein n=1 Tax=Abeliophyllum distichum TaxID=126358 RepID=A0ABD1Q9Y9_9LAMI